MTTLKHKLTYLVTFIWILNSQSIAQSISQTNVSNKVDQTINPNIGSKGSWANYSTSNLSSADGVNVAYNDIGLDYASGARECTNYLDFTDFNFNIPANSTIDGIKLTMTRRKAGNGISDIEDDEIRLLINGNPNSLNKSDSAKYNEDTFTTVVFGSNMDLWSETLTDSIINSVNFGVRISAARYDSNGINNQVPEIDYLSITIYYTQTSLPVNLHYFKGEVLPNNSRRLYWRSITETNSDKFIVERRMNNEFIPIAQIQGKGNSNMPVSYEVTDSEFLEDSILYYRLTQTDLDGDREHFKIISLHQFPLEEILLYPNPTNDKITLRYNQSRKDEQVRLIVTKPKGKLIFERVLIQNEVIELNDLVSGIYFVSLFYSSGRMKVYKFVKN